MYLQIIAFLLSLQSFTPSSLKKAIIPHATVDIVYESKDGGQTWQDASAGLPKDFNANCIFVSNDEIMLGYQKGLYTSKLGAHSPKWNKELVLNENVSSIYPGKFGPYAYSYENGFFQDAANTGIWMPIYSDLKGKTFRSILETNQGAIFIGTDSGIFKSKDKGKTWKQVFSDGMVLNLIEKDGLLMGGSMNGVLKSTDDGEHWNVSLTELGMAKNVAIIEGGFAAISSGINPNDEEDENQLKPIVNTLSISKDGGKTWKRIDENLMKRRLIFAFGDNRPQISNIIDIEQVGKYIFCSLDGGIFRSADLGKTWELVLPTNDKLVFDMAVSGQVIYAIKVSSGC